VWCSYSDSDLQIYSLMLILTGVDKYDIQTISSNKVLCNCFTMYITYCHVHLILPIQQLQVFVHLHRTKIRICYAIFMEQSF